VSDDENEEEEDDDDDDDEDSETKSYRLLKQDFEKKEKEYKRKIHAMQ
jgi:hypothetical protein